MSDEQLSDEFDQPSFSHVFPSAPKGSMVPKKAFFPSAPTVPVLPMPIKSSSEELTRIENYWRDQYNTIIYKLYLKFNASACFKDKQYIDLNNKLKEAYDQLTIAIKRNTGGTRKKKQSMQKKNNRRKKSNKRKNG